MNSCVPEVKKSVEECGLTWEEFNELRVKNSDLLSPEQRDKMIKIRNSVPQPTKDTLMQKAISQELFAKYLKDRSTVKGFVSRAQDTLDLYTFTDFYKVLRLDYDTSEFTQYISKDDGSLYLIKFKSYHIDEAIIPFSKKLGGEKDYDDPNTGNGFLSSPEEHIAPEYRLKDNIPVYSAEIYEITKDGKEILRAIYREESGKFETVNN